MTERQFLKRAATSGAALTAIALLADRVIPHDPMPVAPFGEPWLTIVGGAAIWLSILVVSHVARWVYLIVSGRGPNLG